MDPRTSEDLREEARRAREHSDTDISQADRLSEAADSQEEADRAAEEARARDDDNSDMDLL